MKITALVCNSSYVLESVIRNGETKELKAERQFFCLQRDLYLIFTNDGEALRVTYGEEADSLTETEVHTDTNTDAMLPLRTRNGETLILLLYFLRDDSDFLGLFGLCEGGEISVGRADTSTIRTPGLPLLSSNHLRVFFENGVTSLEVYGENGCYVNNRFFAKKEKLRLDFGDEIILYGLKLTWLKEYFAVFSYSDLKRSEPLPSVAISPELNEYDLCKLNILCNSASEITARQPVHPIPRTIRRFDLSPVRLDAPPHKQTRREESLFLTIGPAFSMAVPMLLGSGLAIYGNRQNNSSGGAFLYTGLITAVSAAMLGAFWAILNLRRRQKEERRNERRRAKAYSRYMKETEAGVFQRYTHNREVLFYMNPAIAKLSEGILLPYFWNRSPADEDYLSIRLGIGTYPGVSVNLEVPAERFSVESDRMQELPARLQEKYGLLKEVPISVDLQTEYLFGLVSSDGLKRLSLLFLAALQLSYFISAAQLLLAFFFTGDTLPESGLLLLRFLPHIREEEAFFLCIGSEQVREGRKRLSELIKKERLNGTKRERVIFSDDYVTVKDLLSEESHTRLLLVKERYEELPKECRVVLQNDPDFHGILHTRNLEGSTTVAFDPVAPTEAERIVRRLAGAGPFLRGAKTGIPDKVFLEQILGMPVTGLYEQILKNWRENDTLTDLKIPIGIAGDGQICYLDPHENAHGPHGLVAGMTGSGKSEMLQTLILSLLIRFSPKKAAFFLIDYKGGGMAELFKGLPHICGSISNLSGSHVYRAMVSIRSENERRQKLFLAAGVNNIREYEKKHMTGQVTEPLPHIFIIIDEFAELKKNEPEFMRELVSVAQVGRSLGIHLILATQKPQGTVDDKISGNARFRICLRVQDKQDSFDMLKKPDAALLTGVGRAFLQVGNDEVYEEFQGAYTMAAGSGRKKREAILLLSEHENGDVRTAFNGGSGEKRELLKQEGDAGSPQETGTEQISDFYLIKSFIAAAAKETGIEAARQLWTKELPEEVIPDMSHKTDSYIYPVGRFDAPKRQEQGVFYLDLNQSGHIAVLGRSGCGKSTFLQMFLYACIAKEKPQDLSIYILDYGNSALSAFRESRLSGAWLTEEEEEKTENLFILLAKEMLRRKSEFEGVSFQVKRSMGEGTTNRIMLVIDNFGAFRVKTRERFDGPIRELLKNGEAYGITLVLTAGGLSASDLPARVHEGIKTVICLSFSDRMQYAQALRAVRCEVFPDDRVRGRGLAFVGSELLEFQTGLICKGNDYERQVFLRDRIKKRNAECLGACARPVPFIPKHADLNDLIRAARAEGFSFTQEAQVLPAGFQVRGGEVWYVPLEGSCFLVSGRKKSGKTNLVRILQTIAELCGLMVCSVTEPEELNRILKEDQEKKKLIVFKEIAENLNRFYEKSFDRQLEAELIERITSERNRGLSCIVLECSREDTIALSGRKLFEELKSEALGVHLGGMINDQNLFDFSELSFTQKNSSKKAGEGDVPCVLEEQFYGEVRIPVWVQRNDT
ncbi:MAG: FHA domain-containing protein [Lachnospiraceae bacterium]|nr:FHA domain-containing protein [Lachnospiraceae bacterium]